MRFEFVRESETGLIVYRPEINGCEWSIIRKIGQGTYARIAGPDDDSDDIQMVIEEHTTPEYRKIWDSAEYHQVIEWAYDTINE